MSKCEFDAMVKVDPNLARVNFARWIVARTIDSAEDELADLRKMYQRYVNDCYKRRWYRLWRLKAPVSFEEFFLGTIQGEYWSSLNLHFMWQRVNHFAHNNANKLISSQNCEDFYVDAQRWGAVCSWAESYQARKWPSRASALEEICALADSAFKKLNCSPTISVNWLRRTITEAIEIAQEGLENED